MAIASVNPATGQTLKTFPALDDQEIEQALSRAATAFAKQRRVPLVRRAQDLLAVAGLLEREKEKLGRLITEEMGKLLREAIGEVEKCALGCRYYAENAARFLEDKPVQTAAARSYVTHQPLGAILAIMPWNFPFWQVFRFAAPALMAGNVGLLKHAANVPQCAIAIADLFHRAGYDDGVFQTLLIDTKQVQKIIEDDRVAAVTLTGSERAGREVAAIAGRCIKKSVLELGGSDPFIVTASANVREAIAVGVKSRTQNSGQSCIAAKRFIIAQEVYDEFVEGFVAQMRGLKLGDPLDGETDIGPLATKDILLGVDEQVRKSVAAGAKLLTGGNRLQQDGYFYEPTVLTDIPHAAPAYREEVFGPVALLFRAKNNEQAIALANDTTFGLGASVWTNDAEEKELFAAEIEAGMVFINSMVASDPRLPFGGVKRSGIGRELSAEGIREFVNIKTISIGS